MVEYGVILYLKKHEDYGCIVEYIESSIVKSFNELIDLLKKYNGKICEARVLLLTHDSGLVETSKLREFCEVTDYEYTICEEVESDD